jgi:hypothetical protein
MLPGTCSLLLLEPLWTNYAGVIAFLDLWSLCRPIHTGVIALFDFWGLCRPIHAGVIAVLAAF